MPRTKLFVATCLLVTASAAHAEEQSSSTAAASAAAAPAGAVASAPAAPAPAAAYPAQASATVEVASGTVTIPAGTGAVGAPIVLHVHLMAPAASAAATTAAATAASGVSASASTDAQVSASKPGDLIGYDKGFFLRSADGEHQLKVNARVMPRYSGTTEVTAGERTTSSAFDVPSAPLVLSGHTFTSDLRYKAIIDFGKGQSLLKEFFVDAQLIDGLVLRVGQFTRPFSRQQINSFTALQLVDRAITDKAFGNGRDIGVALHNDYEKSPFLEWVLGAFNGTGEASRFSGTADPDTGEVSGSFSNVPQRFKPVVVGRFGINLGGIKGYTEADLEGGGPRAAFGVSALVEGDADDDDSSAARAQVDALFKAYGFSGSAALYEETDQESRWSDRGHARWGFHLQAGQMIGDRHELVARFALVDPDDDTFTGESTAGYSFYLSGHTVKWQTDVSVLHADGRSFDEGLRGRTQISVGF
jgi:hypothetical protein